MSESNGKTCCNCRHRIFDGYSSCYKITGAYLHYRTVKEKWCRHWSKDHRWDVAEAICGQDDHTTREEAHNESD